MKQRLAIFGSFALLIGIFLPFIRLPIVGSTRYFLLTDIQGISMLLVSVISLYLSFEKKFRALWLTGGIAIGHLSWIVWRFEAQIHATKDSMSKVGSPFFAEIGRALTNNLVQYEIGTFAMFAGAACLLAVNLLTVDDKDSENVLGVPLDSSIRLTRALGKLLIPSIVIAVIGGVCFWGYSSYQSRLAKQTAAKEKAELVETEQKAREAETARIAELEIQRKQAELARELERQKESERLNALRLQAEADKQNELMLQAEKQRLDTAQAKQKLLAAENTDLAWKKFYVITPKCQADYTLECANVYMQKKQEFELYLARKK